MFSDDGETAKARESNSTHHKLEHRSASSLFCPALVIPYEKDQYCPTLLFILHCNII